MNSGVGEENVKCCNVKFLIEHDYLPFPIEDHKEREKERSRRKTDSQHNTTTHHLSIFEITRRNLKIPEIGSKIDNQITKMLIQSNAILQYFGTIFYMKHDL
ncbi:hypothetical protein QQG55_36430 [Brugia pahangi]